MQYSRKRESLLALLGVIASSPFEDRERANRDDQFGSDKKAGASQHINTQPYGYNHGVNDGKAVGRTSNHFHWHIPRFDGDMDDPAEEYALLS